jgi:hypothetical protein
MSLLHPYKSTYQSDVKFAGNGIMLSDEDALKKATADSLSTLRQEDKDLARAIDASINDSQAIQIDDGYTPPRAQVRSSNPVVYVLSPGVNAPDKGDTIVSPDYKKCVQKQALK